MNFLTKVSMLLLFSIASAFAQSLPPKMEGWYNGQRGSDKTYIELVKIDGDKAVVKFFVASAFCDHGVVEGTAEKKADGWEINVPSARCASWVIKLKPVEGKQRLTGTFQASSGNFGTVYYDW